ncbi:Uu.00g042020.m01.CDS01 [Anthostomella pinea]|uniref:Uu.00g042020.m01.CDS01 n=1 Tax=Anthostomella pinea TaxID=933095 RepID=A0AAI8VAG6_9PEZI|nr:Uu.00g042020.m01.CDS01 [Anthostomella pinea]
MDDGVEQFMTVTGVASGRIARGYLDISNGDPMQAITLFFENPDLQASFSAPSAAPAASAQPSRATRRTGREDAGGVIHIDSDDDEDVSMTDDPINDSDDDGVIWVARNAQEEEDAEMARRLQDELYGPGPGGAAGSGASEDGVRAPIARTTEMLAAPDPSWGLHDEDREAAVLEQIRARRHPPRRPHNNSSNPFQQTPGFWDDASAPPVPSGTRPGPAAAPVSRPAMLASLFRPPYDLMSPWTWDHARDEGKDQKKWLLVNLQDLSVFQCQALNRDHWKNDDIKSLVKEHFIFLQYDKTDPTATDYIQFYFPNEAHENQDNYPHVSVVDPRTGEQVKVWSGSEFPSVTDFYSELVEFLDRYSLAANSKNPVVKSKPKAKQVDVGRLTEEEMLQLAMQNSLDNDGGSSGSNVEDPDSLTKSKGKGKATDEAVDLTGGSEQAPPPPTVESTFAQISAISPHVEPENNPATTTRIQFRHSGGRVIRRFNATDTVRCLFEWLKAEPLEGKEGVQFELKAMPAGRDLIEELDKTIEEAGLKQGTVMIEFLEDS